MHPWAGGAVLQTVTQRDESWVPSNSLHYITLNLSFQQLCLHYLLLPPADPEWSHWQKRLGM